MRCKPPCLAWVSRAQHPENQNRIVSVLPESIIRERGLMWKVTSGEPMKGVNLETGLPFPDGVRSNNLWCYDSDLTPINDPGIDTKDVERPKPVVEEWEFPKENEHV